MRVHIIEDIAFAVADWMLGYIDAVLQTKGYFTLALSEGSSLNELYKLLISDVYKEQIDWSKVHTFLAEGKGSMPDNENNNAQTIYNNLLKHVNVLPEHIHAIQSKYSNDISVPLYNAMLHQYFDMRTTTFDLVLLEINHRGDVLSWGNFPPVTLETTTWITSITPLQKQMNIISLTPAIINNAASIALLASGLDKATIMNDVLGNTPRTKEYIVQLIKPERGALHWFIDDAAAGGIKNKKVK